jgi:excisionase family DNA binding protein
MDALRSPNSFEPLWHPADAATYLGIHEKTAIKMARLGQLPALRLGKHWRFRASDLTAWAEQQVKSTWNKRSRPCITKLKTAASRKGVPMTDDLAELLAGWRSHTPYPADHDWVFASPNEQGRWPYNPSAAMRCLIASGWYEPVPIVDPDRP